MKDRIQYTCARASPLVMATLSPAHAGPPSFTDDPEPVDYRQDELYQFTAADKTNGARSVVGPAFEFNIGVLPNVQFHVVAPRASFSAPDAATLSGYGDTEIGIKFRVHFGERSRGRSARRRSFRSGRQCRRKPRLMRCTTSVDTILPHRS